VKENLPHAAKPRKGRSRAGLTRKFARRRKRCRSFLHRARCRRARAEHEPEHEREGATRAYILASLVVGSERMRLARSRRTVRAKSEEAWRGFFALGLPRSSAPSPRRAVGEKEASDHRAFTMRAAREENLPHAAEPRKGEALARRAHAQDRAQAQARQRSPLGECGAAEHGLSMSPSTHVTRAALSNGSH